jgi:carboxymethylenebutenolidase
MPIYEPDHVEYTITNGNIRISMDDGRQLPAYWAHPVMGTMFPGVAIVHDWWGITPLIRRMANLFAQMGHYVIVPDLFNGRTAQTPRDALALLEETKEHNYTRADDALKVLENHHHCNKSVAVVGLGMGGSLAYEAAINRDDLEAAVAYAGFPDRYIGQFGRANTPICAFFGENEQHIRPQHIKHMRQEMLDNQHGIHHEIHIIPELAHDFFTESLNEAQRQQSRLVIKQTLDFLDRLLERPSRAGDRMVY